MNTVVENQTSEVAKTETFDIIKGNFTAEEASEIINDFFGKKINFHQTRGFSQLLRFGKEEAKTLERIEELMEAQKQARVFIQEALVSGRSVKLTSTISVELI